MPAHYVHPRKLHFHLPFHFCWRTSGPDCAPASSPADKIRCWPEVSNTRPHSVSRK